MTSVHDQSTTVTEVRCTDGCGEAVETPEQKGWTLLQITGRWRCPNCVRALDTINQQNSVQQEKS